MNNDTPATTSKQFLIHNDPGLPNNARRVTVLLDDQLVMRKYVRKQDLDNKIEIIIGPSPLRSVSRLALIDLEIPGAVGPLPNDAWGINSGAARDNFPQQGLQLYVPPWSQMGIADGFQILLDGKAVASGSIATDAEVGKRVTTFVVPARLTNGAHTLSYIVTRVNQQAEPSGELDIFVKLEPPGGQDQDGSVPGHSELRQSLPQSIIDDGVDADAAKAGVVVTIQPYPEMTEGDDIKLSWGGQFVHHDPVEQSEVGKAIPITVDEATILAAGDSGDSGLAVTFEVYDLVQNRSEDWSAEQRILVDTGNSRLDAPIIKEAVNSVLDLDDLGNAPATVQMVAKAPVFSINDKIVVNVSGTSSDGGSVSYDSREIVLDSLPKVIEEPIPNAIVRRLAKSQAVFSYCLLHAAGGADAASRRSFINIIGEVTRMAAPIATDAVQGALDPDLPSTRIQIPWDESMAAGDQIILRWIGTLPNLEGYDPQLTPHNISAGEADAEQPINFTVAGEHLKRIEGGTLDLYFELVKDINGQPVIRNSATASRLHVGEPQAELPAPIVDGVVGGVMAPDLPGTTLTVPVYPPVMAIGDIVHYLWKGSDTGNHGDQITINSLTKDKPVVFNIDASFIAPNDGGTVAASYWVDRIDGRRSDSQILDFSVGSAVPLDPPTISNIKDSTGAEIPNGTTTDSLSTTLSGSAAADQRVEIFDGNISKGTTLANASGNWTMTLDTTAIKTYAIKAVALYGESMESPVRTFVVERIGAIAITQVKDENNNDIPNGGSTTSTTVTVIGSVS